MTERRADDATRDVMAWLKCEFLSDHVGEEFDGVIAAVVPFGFFVELSGVYIEGLVHVSTLSGDYFHHDSAKHRLIGERTAVSFRLGDELRVRVTRVGMEDRKIDLELVSEPKRRQADRDALDVAKRDTRGKNGKRTDKSRSRGGSTGAGKSAKGAKTGKAVKTEKAGKPASAKAQLAAEAAREASKKPKKGSDKPAGASKPRKPRKTDK